MKILITGASGFIGKKLCLYLHEQGYEVYAVVRSKSKIINGIKCVTIDSIDRNTIWMPHLVNVDVVIHLAAKAHIYKARSSNDFKEVNIHGTNKLVADSLKSGIKTFIFMSTVGVNGSRTYGKPYKFSDKTYPHSSYAASKLKAEENLVSLFNSSSSNFVILRSPLVYGKNAPGNVGLIINCIKKNIPLPFGAIQNKRSFVSIENLVSIIELCLKNPQAKNEVLYPSDGFDLSTKEFIKIIGSMYKKSPIIPTINADLINFILVIIGKKRISESLLYDLQVDSSHIFKKMGWKPKINVANLLNKIDK